MEFQFFYLIIVLILIYLIDRYMTKDNSNGSIIEGYDARMTGVTKEVCGRVCTKTFQCDGFAYHEEPKDMSQSHCYLSQTPIIGEPSAGVYQDEYKPKKLRCNKLHSIKSNDTGALTDADIVNNTIYLCSPDEFGPYLSYKIVNGVMEQVDRNSIDKIQPEDYQLEDIVWPKYKKDYKPNLLPPEIETKKYTVFEQDKYEHLGQYLYPYKCVENVTQGECLRTCNENKDCVGVEWNPVYLKKQKDGSTIIHKEVCCPKREISQVINRRKEFENGRYYVKKKYLILEKDRNYITLLGQ